MSGESVFLMRDQVVGAGGHVVGIGFTDARFDLGDRASEEDRTSGLARVAEATGAIPVIMRQVHGVGVHLVESPGAVPEADALVTAHPGVALVTRAADCVPVLLAAPDEGIVGAVHAGRSGVALGVVTRAVERMRSVGAHQITAWVGPHICAACYEVPEAMRAEVAAAVPATHAQSRWGTPALDLGAGVAAQLEAAGCALTRVPGCTRENPALHSHRRDGADAGRFAGVIWRTDAPAG